MLPAHPALPIRSLASSPQIVFPDAASCLGKSPYPTLARGGECRLGQTSAVVYSFLLEQTLRLCFLCPRRLLLLSCSLAFLPARPLQRPTSAPTLALVWAHSQRHCLTAPSSASTDCWNSQSLQPISPTCPCYLLHAQQEEIWQGAA